MSSHHSFAFSRMTFGDNPYIPPPNLSIKNDLITKVSSKQSNQMDFHSNFSAENFNSVDTLIYYPIKGKTDNMQLPKKSEQSLIEGLMPKNQRKIDILQPQSPNYVSFPQPINHDPIPQPTNLASVTQPINYDPVPQPTNYAPIPQPINYTSIPQPRNYDSVPQLTNYASVTQISNYASIPQPTNYAMTTLPNNYPSVTLPNNYPSVTLPNNYPQVTLPNNYPSFTLPNNYPQVTRPKNYASDTQITKHTSIPQNSKPLILDLMPQQEKNDRVLIPQSDYHLVFSNEPQQIITDQQMPDNSQIFNNEDLISQPYNEAINYGQISQHQVQESKYDPLYQFQGQLNDNKTTSLDYQNIEIKQSKSNKFNSHANEINVPEESYKENILNEFGSTEEKGYSFNQMNNKIVSIGNRLEEKIIKQDNLNEWFRKAVGELKNTNEDMGKTFKEISETFKEMEKLHKEQKCLNEKIFDWMQRRLPYSEYPIYN